jgi:hypothetical protein
MGLAESGLREEAGDYAGAVIAAFKELLYAYGAGGLGAEQLRAGLEAVLFRESGNAETLSRVAALPGEEAQTAGAEAAAQGAALACLEFFDGRWKEAAGSLAAFCDTEEPDSFARWMFLASLLKSGLLLEAGFAGGDEDAVSGGAGEAGTQGMAVEHSVFNESRRAALAEYSAIRARYAGLAAYWYHLALVSGEGAERCVDLAPQGPYAAACRKILAENFGLQGTGAALRTKKEIERAVSSAAAQGSVVFLEELFPLLALEDNPLTFYALGALNALAASPLFREYFAAKGRESSGRLGERLRYITGGRL